MGRLDTNMKRANYNTGQLVKHKTIGGLDASAGVDLQNKRAVLAAQKNIQGFNVRGEVSSDFDGSNRRKNISAQTQRKIAGANVGAYARTDDKGNRDFFAQASKTTRGGTTYGVRVNKDVKELFFEKKF
jgi:hypothetical protein